MLNSFRTLYVAFIIMVSKKIFLWCGKDRREIVLNSDEAIQFNPPSKPTPSNQSFEQGLLTDQRNYYNHLSYLPLSSLGCEVMFLLGTKSTAWQVFELIFKTTSWIYSIKLPSIQLNKRSHMPIFKSRGYIKAWLSMFERHHQDISNALKSHIIIDFLSPEVNEEFESFLLKDKSRASYQKIRKALLGPFAKHGTFQDPVMALVSRAQQDQENLFQYIRALKRLSREASTDEIMELASECESKLKKTDTFKYKLQTNKLATVESVGEITELRTCTVDKK